MNTMELGDAIERMGAMPADSFDAMLTDPPYHLTSSATSAGFMGKAWDGGDVAFQSATWKAALRVLKPGAFALVFGGTRTWHRLATALEDAGFEIRDTLMWLHGSGFPKSMNVGKAIDKAAGAEREIIGCSARWEGYGTALKPAWEPILLVRKPTALTFAANALQHGCGALNIEGSRVSPGTPVPGGAGGNSGTRPLSQPHDQGRWPANVALDEEAAAMLDAQAGRLTSGATPQRRSAKVDTPTFGSFSRQDNVERIRGENAGGASRFYYTTKAATAEREAFGNTHPTVKPLDLDRWLATLLLPPSLGDDRRLLVPFAGSGSEMVAALQVGWEHVTGIEREAEYAAIARRRLDAFLQQPGLFAGPA